MQFLLLAGGKSSRMEGQDKALISYKDKPMIEHTIGKLPLKDGDRLIISANRNHDRFKSYTSHVLKDSIYAGIEPFAGPLLGILSVLDNYPCQSMVVLPCDTPNISQTIIQELILKHQQSSSSVTCLTLDKRIQPLHVVINSNIRNDLFEFLHTGNKKAQDFIQQQNPCFIDCSNFPEQFANINHRNQLA